MKKRTESKTKQNKRIKKRKKEGKKREIRNKTRDKKEKNLFFSYGIPRTVISF